LTHLDNLLVNELALDVAHLLTRSTLSRRRRTLAESAAHLVTNDIGDRDADAAPGIAVTQPSLAVAAPEVLAVGAGVLVDSADLVVDVGREVGARAVRGHLDAGTGVDVGGTDEGVADRVLADGDARHEDKGAGVTWSRGGNGESETGEAGEKVSGVHCELRQVGGCGPNHTINLLRTLVLFWIARCCSCVCVEEMLVILECREDVRETEELCRGGGIHRERVKAGAMGSRRLKGGVSANAESERGSR
jgi:hypothetical protein